jgi:hypothetical protein
MADSNPQNLPADGDFQRAKRDLLREAVRDGRILLSRIKKALPPSFLSVAELELFLFSLEALGVEVVYDL